VKVGYRQACIRKNPRLIPGVFVFGGRLPASHMKWLEIGRQLRYIFYTMKFFEFDPAKSDSNYTKHGIDFVEAQVLWDDPMLLEIPAKIDDEPRYLVIGLIDGKHWSAVITYRGDNVRLISVRRARTEEVVLYES